MRPPLAVLAGLAVAVIAGLVLGEYNFGGWAVMGSGLLTGLFVAEAAVAVARKGSALLAGACALLSAGALTWAGWTSTGQRLGDAGWKGWAAVALAAAAGGIRARPTGAARRSRSAAEAAE